MNLTLKTEKQEINYFNYSNALLGCFGFHIFLVGNMLPKQAMLPGLAINPDWSKLKKIKKFKKIKKSPDMGLLT